MAFVYNFLNPVPITFLFKMRSFQIMLCLLLMFPCKFSLKDQHLHCRRRWPCDHSDSFLIGQSNTVMSLKSRGHVDILSVSHGNINKMTPPVFALYVTCLLLGRMGKLYLLEEYFTAFSLNIAYSIFDMLLTIRSQ